MRVQREGDKYAHIQTKSRNHSFINAYDFCSLLKLMTLRKIKVCKKNLKKLALTSCYYSVAFVLVHRVP